MIWVKPVTRNAILASLLLLLLFGVLFQSESARAQLSYQFSLIARIRRFLLGSRPQGTATGRKRGGAVRDRCPNIQPPLTALVPSTPDGKPFLEKTIRERPSFWFYVPFFPTSSRNAEFVIIDENEEDIYAAKFSLAQQPGIVRLQLPNTMPPFQEGKRYRWFFSIVCNLANRSGDATVNGWVQRVPLSPELNRQLQQGSGLKVILAYADVELWYEMITAIAEFQRMNPQSLQAKDDWMKLLDMIGLTNFALDNWKTYPLPKHLPRLTVEAK